MARPKKDAGKMTAAEFEQAQASLKMTQKQFCDQLGITCRTAQLYQKGREIPRKVALAVRFLLKK